MEQRAYCVITGEEGGIRELVEDYFDDLERKIDSHFDNLLAINDNLRLHPHFERRELGVRRLEHRSYEPLRPDDHVYMLLYKDSVVAVVTEQRDTMNWVQFSFFDNLESVLKKEAV